MNVKNNYISPKSGVKRLRVCTLLVGSDSGSTTGEEKKMNWTTNESIDPTSPALARKRGGSSLD